MSHYLTSRFDGEKVRKNMNKCESRNEAAKIAKYHCEFHNKIFPNDKWKVEIMDWAKEIWIRNKYNDVVEIYQW